MEQTVYESLFALLDDFGKPFFKHVYGQYYDYISDSFYELVKDQCKLTLFGKTHSMDATDLYYYDQTLARDVWLDYVDSACQEFRNWLELSMEYVVADFVKEFEVWLAEQEQDDDISNVIVALMTGEVNLEDTVIDWLNDRIVRDANWDYPA